MKQTAVEYAVEKLENFIPSGYQIVIAIILEEAKRMEKQQIMDAYNELYNHTGEQYYNKKFKE